MPDDVLSTEPTTPTAAEQQPTDPAVPAPDPAETPPAETPEQTAQPQPEPGPAPPNPDAEVKADSPKPAKRGKAAKAKDEEPTPEPTPPQPDSKKRWYAVKVQSGREESIKEAIERRVKIEGLEEYYGQILIPVERVQEIKGGKRVVKERKKFPGYLMAEVEFNDKILYLFRETSGVGDFVGASLTRAPSPMTDREVQQMLSGQEELPEGTKLPTPVAPTKIPFNVGDKVKVRDGTFQNMEGEIKEIREPKDSKDTYRIKVELTVWGRPVSVEVDYWQIDHV